MIVDEEDKVFNGYSIAEMRGIVCLLYFLCGKRVSKFFNSSWSESVVRVDTNKGYEITRCSFIESKEDVVDYVQIQILEKKVIS